MGLATPKQQMTFFDVDQVLTFMHGSPTDPSAYQSPALGRFQLFRDKVLPKLEEVRPQLEAMYCAEIGRPATDPVRLLGVSILQFMEGLPDRQAVEILQYDLRWKFALHMEIDARAFHSTTLVNFRSRLLEHDLERIGFESVLDLLVAEGVLPKRRKERLDSTHVLANISQMSRVERVRETIRLALEELKDDFPRPERWELWNERYIEGKLDYRSADGKLANKMIQAGHDGLHLLAWIKTLPKINQERRQVRLLQRVMNENFEWNRTDPNSLEVIKIQASGSVSNPHDPEAHYRKKSKDKNWVGYLAQVAETVQDDPVEPGEPTKNVVTAIITQEATGSDERGLTETEAAQADMGLSPTDETYVDGAYVSGAELHRAEEEGRKLMGPAPRSPKQKKSDKFVSSDFDVDVENRSAVCPGGHASTQCSRLEVKKTGDVNFRFEWSTCCHDCPLFDQCVGKDLKHRTLVVSQHHTSLQQRRIEMKTDEFKQHMKRRAGIEGTISELKRKYGLRRTRYRGRKKTSLQNFMIGAACNIARWFRRTAWEQSVLNSAIEAGST